MAIFKPKGPLPLYLRDLEEDTVGWLDDIRMKYLRVLSHLWTQGGIMAGDDRSLLEVARIHKGQGYQRKLDRIRSKLVPLTAQLDIWEAELAEGTDDMRNIAKAMLCRLNRESIARGETAANGMVTQKRILGDIAKAYCLSQKRSVAGKRGGRPRQSNSFSDEKQLKSSPTLTKKERLKQKERPSRRPSATATANRGGGRPRRRLSKIDPVQYGLPGDAFCVGENQSVWPFRLKFRLPDGSEQEVEKRPAGEATLPGHDGGARGRAP